MTLACSTFRRLRRFDLRWFLGLARANELRDNLVIDSIAQIDTLSLPKDLSAGVSRWISYQCRDDEGMQSSVETLKRGWGILPKFRGPVH